MESPKSFACPHCNKAFSGQGLLDLHMERVHRDLPEMQESLQAKKLESVAYEHLESGASPNLVTQRLVEQGVSRAEAEQVVSNALLIWKNYRKSEAMDDIWPGIAVLGVGLLITFGTLLALPSEGGVYLLAWGPLLYGGYRILKGLGKLL